MTDPKSKAFLTKNISSSGKSRSVTSLIGGNRRDEVKEKDKPAVGTSSGGSSGSPPMVMSRTGSAPSPVSAVKAFTTQRPSSFAMAKPSGQARANVIGNSGFRTSLSPTTGHHMERQIMEAEENGGSSPSTPPASPSLDDDDEITSSNYDDSVYPFTVEDSDQTILFEDKEESNETIRKVKGATLPKLVERLTFAAYPGAFSFSKSHR